MMRSIAVIVFAAAMVVGTIWALVHFVGLQASLIWTALLGAIAWVVQNAVHQQQEYRRLLADQKRQQYFEFLDFLNSYIQVSGEPAKEEENSERLRQFRRWSLRLTMIGSDEVVRAWNQARNSALFAMPKGTEQEKLNNTIAIFRAWGALWLAMRKDCGHFDTKLTVPDMLASFVNDIDLYRGQL